MHELINSEKQICPQCVLQGMKYFSFPLQENETFIS